MDNNEDRVHATHCCIKHGCKYGENDCPVVNNKIKQLYRCESCVNEGINSIDELHNSSGVVGELKNMVKINETTKLSVSDDMIKIHQLNWNGKDYTTIYLDKKDLDKILEELNS